MVEPDLPPEFRDSQASFLRALRLTVEDAAKLRRSVGRGGAAADRGVLLAFYGSRGPSPPRRMVNYHSEQLVWWIENKPESPLLSTPAGTVDPSNYPAHYQRAKKAWLRTISGPAREVRLLTNASRFFEVGGDAEMAQRLLRRALRREPSHGPTLSRLGSLQWRNAQGPRGVDKSMAKQAAASYRAALSVIPKKFALARVQLLGALAQIAYRSGDHKTARSSAVAVLRTAIGPERERYAVRVGSWWRAHSVLGLLALQSGANRNAVDHLRRSLAPGTTNYDDLSLAGSLLLRGERASVETFLVKLMRTGVAAPNTVAPWISQLSRGEFPTFGRWLLL